MRITKTMLQTVMWKIKSAKYNEKKEAKNILLKEKNNSKEVKKVQDSIKNAQILIEDLPASVISNSYVLRQFIEKTESCWNKSLAEVLFADEFNKIDWPCEAKDMEFELTLLADASETMTEFVTKAEEKFNIKIV